ncbi:VanZ family protein [Bacillus thuringiensis]|uniref:VanZ family protein n=1 Tax=Bacillus thuringiensis TaxID=1428 RepID=UPI002E177428|nr:VanZ family protein [Bacillus thuringiensis]
MGVNFKLFWKFIFYIYILLVINFVIFKFFGDINSVKNNIQLTYESINNGGSNLSLIPFRTIFSYGTDLYMEISFINIVGNIIPFIPLGFLIPIVFPTRKPFIKTMNSCLGIIICIEVIQLITFLGRMDIDDVILNQISCVIGYLLYIVFKKTFGNKLGIQQKSS